MAGPSVEELTLSLVREFLSRKGLKVTLAALDQESPRTPASISNRGGLARAVGVEKLMKKNKELPDGYRTILEVVVKWLVSKTSSSSQQSVLEPSRKQKSLDSGDTVVTSISAQPDSNPVTYKQSSQGQTAHDKQCFTHITHDKQAFKQDHTAQDKQAFSSAATQVLVHKEPEQTISKANRKDQNPRPVNTGLVQSGNRASSKKFKPRGLSGLGVEDLDNQLSVESFKSSKPQDQSIVSDDPVSADHSSSRSAVVASRASPKVTTSSQMLFEDLEDSNLTEDWAPVVTNQIPVFPRGTPITMETAKGLRELLFGSCKGQSFNSEWKQQNFIFSNVPGLEYGLVQHKGGPCGVLAAVQAFILKHLIFEDHHKKLSNCPRPSPEEQKQALVNALADTLWKAGGGQAIVTLLSSAGPTKPSATYMLDNIIERIMEHKFTDKALLRGFLQANLPTLQDGAGHGCILFLYSVLLSKGIAQIRGEMDEPTGRLIGAHQYCSQDLVNLLLTGRAVSNVFDGNIEIGSKGQKVILKGIDHQSEIGLLSLFEHYKSCSVGRHYKNPLYPVWLVCSESHFSVLFAHRRLHSRERNFELHYYDGLANQDEAIRLTIEKKDTNGSELPATEADLVPPLEHCIRTKWEGAVVSWNGTEPIL